MPEHEQTSSYSISELEGFLKQKIMYNKTMKLND